MKRKIAVFLGCLPAAFAQAETRWTAAAGMEFGGDELGKVVFSNGDTESLRLGDGLVVNGGLVTALDQQGEVDLSLTVGWKYRRIAAENGEISISRFPIEATLSRNADQHRFGLGAVYHAGIDIGGSGFGSYSNDSRLDPDSGVGFLVRYDYALNPSFSLGAKYTSLKYTWSEFDETMDASSFGGFVTGRF